jgi:hypothetical protein
MTTIDLELPNTWPADVQRYLRAHHDFFLRWETKPLTGDGPIFDKAIRGLMHVQPRWDRVGYIHPHIDDSAHREGVEAVSAGAF